MGPMKQSGQQGIVGAAVARIEDPPLVRGRGLFAADVSFARQLHMRVVRSPLAHGRIRRVDASDALTAPGVVAVWTGEDLADMSPIDFRDDRVEKLVPHRQPLLARGRVRYVGEPLAVVFADDPYRAEDAADRIAIDIDELPPVMSADDDPVEIDGLSTEPMIIEKGYGDIDAAFRDAHMIVEADVAIGRHSAVPLETRGAIARYDAARDLLELHGAAKVPHRNREQLAKILNRPLSGIHLFEGHVGGGFGVRGELYPEDVLVCLAALRLGRPIKWIEDRQEHFLAANHSRQQRHKLRAAVDKDKTPAATYRSPGRYESTFARERLMDAIAQKLGLDRIEVRRRNLIDKSEMPFERPLTALGDEVVYDSGDYAALLDKALHVLDWKTLQAQLAARRRNGELVGAGVAVFVEKSGLGPTDGVRVSVDPSGAVEVVTGGSSLGQGFETAMAQICAGALGVDYSRIRVIHGQTNRIEHGIGAHATRATVMTGSATHIAASQVRALALDTGAQLMQTPADALTIVDGRVVRKDAPSGPSITLGEIARRRAPGSKFLNGGSPGLTSEGWHHTSHMAYPYGVHVAIVKVDRDTGGLRIERYLIAYDVGRAVNPVLVEGQLVGGFAQGLGGAVSEEFVYSEDGAPVATTFADYHMLTAHEVPPVDVLLTEDAPSPLNALGLKGAGEGGVNAVGAAIASAIDDAIGKPGAITQLPVTPARLKALLKEGS
jgi:carbon-monoxide dehydrogenase large subunit